mgnify:FL=1
MKRNPNLTLGGEFFSKLPSGPSVAHDIVAWDNEVKSWSYHMGYGRRPFLFTDKLRVEKNYEFRDAIHSMLLLMDRPEYIEKIFQNSLVYPIIPLSSKPKIGDSILFNDS